MREKPNPHFVCSKDLDLSDVPLSLPEFANGATVNPKRYSSVLQRSEQDGIGFEDVDTLQLELEALLSATVVRKLTLRDEIKVLANVERYKGTNKSYKKVIENTLLKQGYYVTWKTVLLCLSDMNVYFAQNNDYYYHW